MLPDPRRCAPLRIAAVVLFVACEPAPLPDVVSRADLVRACFGFDQVVAVRALRGDTLGIDEDGRAVLLDEQAYDEADAVCAQLEDWADYDFTASSDTAW